MKKNVMMRVASIMLVLVLLTSSVISGTFAKYVTEATSYETARVAKWGVVVTSTVDSLFAKSYAKDSTTDIANTVVADEEVVAPGTKNDTGVTFSVTGQPEVAVNVAFDLKVNKDVILPAGDDYKDWTINPTSTFDLAKDYTPVVFTLTNGVNTWTGTLSEIETELEGLNKDYPAGTDLSTVFGTFTLTWAWDFDDSGAGTNDKADTLLGNIAAGIDTVAGACTEIDFEVAIKVTQVD